MKVVFRTYTKKDGTPDYGYWAVLQHLEGLKEKDILVRIDIDKKQNLGYDEVDIFCPSLKISHLELKQLDSSKFEATFDTKNLRAVFQVLLNMGKAGNGGHCFEMLIGNKSFCIDGDGNDILESINGVAVNKIKESDRHDWADIYNKDIENNTQDMKNNTVKLNENSIAIKQLCFGLVNGDIPSKSEFSEGDFEGAVDATLKFNGGEINASGYGELDGSDFSLASAEITWNGQTVYIDENSPEADIVSRTISLAGKSDLREGRKGGKNRIKINESTLRKIVAESVKRVLNEHIWASAPTFKELQNVLDKVTRILRKFSNNIPQEHSDEFMKLAGREWNDLWDSLSSIKETVMHINNPRGLSDGDLTFDDLG